MLHWLIVGHIDPSDPTDCTERPRKPKVWRPMSKDGACPSTGRVRPGHRPVPELRRLRYVVCEWAKAPFGLDERVREFARFLAEREGAVVMDEVFMVSWPEWAHLEWERYAQQSVRRTRRCT